MEPSALLDDGYRDLGPLGPGVSNGPGHPTIDDGLEELLQSDKVIARHSAASFHAYLWWDRHNPYFCSSVWQHNLPVDLRRHQVLDLLIIGCE